MPNDKIYTVGQSKDLVGNFRYLTFISITGFQTEDFLLPVKRFHILDTSENCWCLRLLAHGDFQNFFPGKMPKPPCKEC